MQTAIHIIPAGIQVQTPSGRRAVTLDATTLVRNSETGTTTGTNLIRFSMDDEACPGGEWLWDANKLTIIPTYTLMYDRADGHKERTDLRARQVETVGRVVSSLADRGQAWDIAVLDADGEDVTDQFSCFQG